MTSQPAPPASRAPRSRAPRAAPLAVHPGPPAAPHEQPATDWAPSGTPLGRLLVPGGVFGAVAGAFACVGIVDPNEPGHYAVCPLLRYTGVWCPGCGGLRSAHALVHGDLPAALGANAAAVVGYGVFAVLWGGWAVRSVQGRPWVLKARPVHLWTAGVLLTIFTIVRNLPFGGWLHP